MSINASHLARSTVRQLIELGVTDFVLSPGSRNAPLSIALNQAAEKGFIELHIRIDERGAAYYALGISQASKRYVALICTSGTAAANYHPAALEAYHSHSSLLFITADRPARLRKTGANQTTLQDGVLSPLKTIDTDTLVDCASLLTGGPIHINLQFDEPLLDSDVTAQWLEGISINPISARSEIRRELIVAPRSIIVIGHDCGSFDRSLVAKVATESGLPVIAEDPLSFDGAIPHAALFLADPEIREGLKADHIIVIGRTTLSRSINAYVAQSSEVTVIDPRIKGVDSARSASTILFDLPKLVSNNKDLKWAELWKGVGEQARSAMNLEWSEQSVAREISQALPDGAALFIGSSRPVRDIEAFAQPRTGVAVFANRGLAGIDGNISTAFGISTQFKRSYSILGDLTFLHDLSALANPIRSDHTVIVIDNNGGGIFSTLPQAGVDGFEKIFGTPHNLNVESIIRGFGYSVEKVKTVSDLTRSLHHAGLHFVIVEVPDRTKNGLVLKELHQRVASAVRMGSNFA